MKAQNKQILKVVLYSILLLSYALGFIVVFNLKDVLGIGHYQKEKNFTVDINGSSCGLNVELWARHQNEYEHYYGYTLTAFSHGDVGLIGISYLSYTLGTSSSLKQLRDESLDPPIKSYSFPSTNQLMVTKLYQNNNLTIKGYVDIIFIVNGINETHSIPINIGIFITLDGDALNYEWGNISTWLNTIYLACTIIPATFLYRTVKKIRFNKWYNDDLQTRDDHFFKILGRKKKYVDDDDNI